MSFGIIVAQLLHLIVAVAFGGFVWASYRWIRRRSAVIGTIVAITVLVRAAAGVALFWTSYLKLPIAESLQIGNGFWLLFQDSLIYYSLAAEAATTGALYSFDDITRHPSPFFDNTLAVWMMGVGISPAAGMFLNLCIYLAIVLFAVRYFAPLNEWRRDLLCIVGVGAYSFSPVVLIHSTQPLKDELSAALAALACFGMLGLTRLIYRPRTLQDFAAIVTGTAAVALAVLGAAGTRWYYGAIIWYTLALVLAGLTIRGRKTSIPRYLVGTVLVLMVVGLAFRAGAGPNAVVLSANLTGLWRSTPPPSGAEPTPIGGVISAMATAPFDLAKRVQSARTGFLSSGGGTNLVIPLRNGPAASGSARPALTPGAGAAPPLTAGPAATPAQTATAFEPPEYTRGIPRNLRDVTKVVAFGLAVVFVPISVLKAVTGIEIAGGRGLLLVTDIDTVFQDATIVLVIVLLWKQRHAVRDRLAFVLFSLVLSGSTAVLLGYAVTNFGTLWRMRPLLAVPLWLLGVAASHQGESSDASFRSRSAGIEHSRPRGLISEARWDGRVGGLVLRGWRWRYSSLLPQFARFSCFLRRRSRASTTESRPVAFPCT
jgi:hypothetical protein